MEPKEVVREIDIGVSKIRSAVRTYLRENKKMEYDQIEEFMFEIDCMFSLDVDEIIGKLGLSSEYRSFLSKMDDYE